MAPIPQEDLDKINAGPVSQTKALHFRDRNRMLEPGDLETETGYCLLEDGVGFAATKVFMKDVTPAMLDWWFNWHPIEGLRYAIWCPIAHTDCSAGDPEGHKDSCGVDRHTRNYGKRHYPVEGFDVKGAQKLCIHFRTPEEFGLDMAKFKEPNISCLYAGTVQREVFGIKLPINVLMHCIREVDGGVEFRSRYWLGATINRKGEVVKSKMPYPKKMGACYGEKQCDPLSDRI